MSADGAQESTGLLWQILLAEAQTSYLTLASFALLLYEYLLTLDSEVKLFWSGIWTVSQILFLVNRYFIFIVVVFPIVGVAASMGQTMTYNYCLNIGKICYVLGALSFITVQAILTARIWFLFSSTRLVQILAMLLYLVSTIATITFLILSLSQSTLQPGPAVGGCQALQIDGIWRLYLPSFILHTILYALTVIRMLRCEDIRRTPLAKRILRDGGLFYLVVFVSIGYIELGALENMSNTGVYFTATYSTLPVTMISISVTRVMFSIHSLADKLRLRPEWLLNPVELSRIKSWRSGATEREIIVEVETVEPESEEVPLSQDFV